MRARSGTEIAVVGMACRVPGARNVAELWQNLRTGTESIQPYSDQELLDAGVRPDLLSRPNYVKAGAPLPDMEAFDAGFFGFSPREASLLDPQHRQFLECAWEALEDAGHRPDLAPGPIGVFAGSGHNAYLPFNLLTHPDLVASVGFFLLRHTGNDKDFLTTRVSHLLDLRGPSVNVQTACSTSLVAVHLACQSLLLGECDLALAGGATVELPHRQGYLYEEGEILSPDGHCRAFDASARGTVFGSGAGVVVLRRLDDALRDGDRIHAVLLGTAVNNDGALKAGYLAPGVEGQAAVIAEALAVAGVSPDTIGLVEAHGTGTPVGDPIEVAALARTFRTGTDRVGFCALGSIKSNIGHLDTAAGVVALIKASLALRRGEIPPTPHFERPNPECRLEQTPFFINASLVPWRRGSEPRRAGVSSLGVGGTNAHAILEEPPAPRPTAPFPPWQLLLASARSPAALERATANLASHLAERPDQELADVAWTLARGRVAMKYRRAIVARDRAHAVTLLNDPSALRSATRTAPSRAPDLVMLFAGGGAQYPGMGAGLYRAETAYARVVDECLGLIPAKEAEQLRRVLTEDRGHVDPALVERPSVGLPALFIVQLATARLLETWGLVPTMMLGHSMGEYTAAHLAGILSLPDALALVRLRGRLFEQLEAGAMTSVPLGRTELEPFLGTELSIAALNGPALSVASGPVAAIEALEQTLARRDLETIRLRIAVAAHSSMVEPILGEFRRFVSGLQLSAPRIPVASNLSGGWLSAEEAMDPEYWVRHLRETVRFADGLDLVLREPHRALLEVGPGRVLAGLARQHPSRRAEQAVVTTLPHPGDPAEDREQLLGALGGLWLHGTPVDRLSAFPSDGRQRVDLPTYPFAKERHWIEPAKSAAPGAVSVTEAPSEERLPPDRWFWTTTWKTVDPPIPTEPLEPGLILTLDGADSFSSRVIDRLRSAGHEVITVRRGDRFGEADSAGYTVASSDPESWRGLLAELLQRRRIPGSILHLWSGTTRADGPAATRAELESGLEALTHLVRVLHEQLPDHSLQLVAVTRQVERVAGEEVHAPAQAALAGFLPVVAAEFPHLRTRQVDVPLVAPGSEDEASLARSVAATLRAPESRVALRGQSRWIPVFQPSPLRAGSPLPIRSGGNYLITGGLGGLGLAVASRLARTAPIRLFLVSRTRLPPREAWDTIASELGTGELAARIRAIRELEAAGAEVHCPVVDIGAPDPCQQMLRDLLHRWGEIHGVIHAAGVLQDALLVRRTAEETRSIVDPKVMGAAALDQALADRPPDFFLLFSSVSGFAGIPGQADYAAANTALDAFAHWRRSRRPGRTIAIQWSAWREVGMVARLVRPDQGATLARRRVTATDWLVDEHRLASGERLLPGAAFLELAVLAAGPGRTVRDFTIEAPCPIREQDSRTVEARLEGEQLTIRSRRVGEQWRTHAGGRATPGAAPPPRPLDLESIRLRTTDLRDTASTSDLSGAIRLGPRWRSVRQVRYGAGEALIELELAEAFAADLGAHPFHPALVDVATAGAQALIPGFETERPLLVPLSYAQVRGHQPLPRRVLSHVRYRGDGDTGGEFAVFDVSIAAPTGDVLLEVEGFVMMRVRDPGRLLDGHSLAVPGDEPGEEPIALREGLEPEEALDALEAVLGSDSPPVLAVAARRPDRLAALLRNAAVPDSDQASRPLEAALRQAPGVADAALLTIRNRGETTLVAYVAFEPGEHATASELRSVIRSIMPGASVPQVFVEVQEVPRRPDGRPDRGMLPNPFGAGAERVAPRTPMEHLVAALWRELLGLAEVGVHDNFFDAGGHSLLSMRFISRLHKETGVRLRHEDVVVSTLEQLAARCDQQVPAQTPPPSGGLLDTLRDSMFGPAR